MPLLALMKNCVCNLYSILSLSVVSIVSILLLYAALPHSNLHKNHFWLTLQMDYNPKCQIVRTVFVTIRSVKFFHILFFFAVFQETICWKTLRFLFAYP